MWSYSEFTEKEVSSCSQTEQGCSLPNTVFLNHHRLFCYTTPYDSIYCPGHLNQYLAVWRANLRAHSPISPTWPDSCWCPYQQHADRRQDHLGLFKRTRSGNALPWGGVVCAFGKRGAAGSLFLCPQVISKSWFYLIYNFSLQTWNTGHCPLHRLGKMCWVPVIVIHPCRQLGLSRLLPRQTLWKVVVFRLTCSLDKGTPLSGSGGGRL